MQESPFYLLYGRDPQLPTEALLLPPVDRHHVDLDDFKTEMTVHMSEAWEMARANVKKAQRRQKQQYDRRARPVEFKPGDRVFIHMPGSKRGKAHKFARAFHSPYRILELVENGVIARPVDRPQGEPVRVALDRVRVCPSQIPDQFWPQPRKGKTKEPVSNGLTVDNDQDGNTAAAGAPSVWSGRLRSYSGRGRPGGKGGEM